ncbi:MAG TPA: hypothetical protein VLL54_22055 [Pyrinomonadaceae bacterium]|nr:hypothetical protein [Pyrinomonadaceae bacterium]
MKKLNYLRRFFLVIGPAILGAILIATFAGNAQAQNEQYTGNVVGVGGQLGGVVRPFTLRIDGHSSSSETSRAVALLAEGGQDALMREINKKDLGNFSMGAQLARDLNFVQETELAGGSKRIVILFERWLNLFEVRNGTRSEDYPFTYIELTLDRNGHGEGQMIAAARVRFNKRANQIEVENYGIYPARLTNVKLER